MIIHIPMHMNHELLYVDDSFNSCTAVSLKCLLLCRKPRELRRNPFLYIAALTVKHPFIIQHCFQDLKIARHYLLIKCRFVSILIILYCAASCTIIIIMMLDNLSMIIKLCVNIKFTQDTHGLCYL